jgi:hypothetical protein
MAYSASIATGTGPAGVAFELVVLGDSGDILLGPADLGVPPHHPVRIEAAKDAADAALKRDGWKRTSRWDSDYGELYADVEFASPRAAAEAMHRAMKDAGFPVVPPGQIEAEVAEDVRRLAKGTDRWPSA